MAVGITDHLVHEHGRQTMVLHGGPYGQVNDMETVFLVQLRGPPGIQVILSQHKIPKGLKAWIFPDQVFIRLQGGPGLGQIVCKGIVWLRLI